MGGVAVRMRSRRVNQRVMVCLGMGAVGAVILIVALPRPLLFSLLGAGLLTGSYLLYKSGA